MRPLESVVNKLCEQRLGRRPNLDNPTGYNDLIQWLKLHDQRREHITACDKWAARDYVAGLAGEDCLIPARIGIAPDWFPAVVKCSHDSGSARRAETEADLTRAHLTLAPRLSRPYGAEKGEWAYQFVPPRLITEQSLPGPIVDYKFHCSHGLVRWVQVIADRASGKPGETILSPAGSVLPLHMDHKMRHRPDAAAFPGAEAWEALTGLAEKLAAPWRYVRVDLYWSQGQAWFGELTFWPLAGCYLTADEPRFGEMLDLDLTERFEPIVP